MTEEELMKLQTIIDVQRCEIAELKKQISIQHADLQEVFDILSKTMEEVSI